MSRALIRIARYCVRSLGLLGSANTAVGLGFATALSCSLTDAHAAEVSEPPLSSPPDERSMRIAWSLRVSHGVGVGAVFPYSPNPGGQVSLDGEYWLSKYLGVGAKLGLHAFGTLAIGGVGYSSQGATGYSLAPAFTFRAKDATNFPMISVALGYSGGRVSTSYDCEPELHQDCTSYYAESNSGLYGSLTAAWLWHPGGVALGPMIQFAGTNLISNPWGWLLTGGFEIGVGYRTEQPR